MQTALCDVSRDTQERLTKRCSRRLAGLFPPFDMIRILQQIPDRALARRG